MPQLLEIEYRCLDCGKVTDNPKTMICKCGGELRGKGPNITGTETSFGIRRAFYDPKTGRDIRTFKEWERAGFKDPLNSNFKHNPEVKDKIKFYKSRKDRTKAKAVEMAERV